VIASAVGPTVLAVLAIVFVAGAAVAIWILGNRGPRNDPDRPRPKL
jgi:hypothetical protein